MNPAGIVQVARNGFSLLTARERRHFYLLGGMSILAAAFELLSLTSVVPVIGLVFDPSRLERSQSLLYIWNGLGRPDQQFFFAILASTSAAAILASTLFGFVTVAIVQKCGAKWQTRLAARLMLRCLAAPYLWFLDRHSAPLARMFTNDIMYWWRDVIHRLILIVASFFTLALAVAVVVAMAPWIGLGAIALTVALSALIFLPFQPLLRGLAQKNREMADEMLRAASDGISGIKDVKVTRREEYFVGIFTTAFGTAMDSRSKVVVATFLGPALLVLASQMALVAASVAMSRSGLDAAEMSSLMALLLLVASRVVPAVSRIASALNRFTDVAPYINEFHALFQELGSYDRARRSFASGAFRIEGEWRDIEIERLRFRYPRQERYVLDGISLRLHKGKSYGIVGGSGAGKTTLVDLLLGLLEPESGEIRLNGNTVSNLGFEDWQRRIAYVPQFPFLMADTLEANIRFGELPDKDADGRLARAIDRAHIADFCRQLPDGLGTQLGERGVRLSGGQRQRIAIARALYREPAILVLDEATNALDATSERAVQDAIEDMHGDVTTVIVAHRMSAIRKCDRIFVLDAGRIVDAGGYDELLARCPAFRRLASAAS